MLSQIDIQVVQEWKQHYVFKDQQQENKNWLHLMLQLKYLFIYNLIVKTTENALLNINIFVLL